MGPVTSGGRSARAGLARRFAAVVLPALGIFLLLAVSADVILAVRGSDDGLDPGAAPPGGDGIPRVLFLGDSLMSDAEPEMIGLLQDEQVEARFEGAPGTGPLTPQGFWRGQLRRAVEEFNPDVVVIEACCNYDPADPYKVYGGAAVEPDSPEMFQQWDVAMRGLVSEAGSRGAQVFVVAIPDPDPNGPFAWVQPRISRLNQIYADLGVDVIDWRTTLQPDGGYAPTVRVGQATRTVRAPDGLHLTGDGDVLVAETTWEAVGPAVRRDDRSNPAP